MHYKRITLCNANTWTICLALPCTFFEDENVFFQFSNLLGTVYRLGDIIFSHDGNTVICPVGNKISVYDLRNNRSHTLPIEARYNYTTLALAPNGIILIAAEEGMCSQLFF